ncbi:hypothetical protein ACOMHN_045376 [Nucella lapillus]
MVVIPPPPPPPRRPPPPPPQVNGVVSPNIPTVFRAVEIPVHTNGSREAGGPSDTDRPGGNSRGSPPTTKQGKGQSSEEGLLVVTIAVMSGVVVLCLVVCLAVTATVFVRRNRLNRDRRKRKTPTGKSPPLWKDVPQEVSQRKTFDSRDVCPLPQDPCPHCALMVPATSAACAHTPSF